MVERLNGIGRKQNLLAAEQFVVVPSYRNRVTTNRWKEIRWKDK